MGGNIFENAKRVTKDEFETVQSHIRSVLENKFQAQTLDIPFYRSKETFGDIDIIVEKEKVCFPSDPDRFQKLKEVLSSSFHTQDNISINDTVVSFLYKQNASDLLGIQVDLLTTPLAEMNISRDYFSYNDLGNLIGQIAHKMGFSFGHRGLLYMVRENDHVHKVLTVSQETDQILSFLGYDPKTFRCGFDTTVDMFDYVASTPYFNKEMYLLENRNHARRTRDRKRTNYRGFLEYIDKKNNLTAYDHPENKNEWFSRASEFFPSFYGEIANVFDQVKQEREIKKIYNGHIVREMTKTEGKELGKIMSLFERKFSSKEEMIAYIKENPVLWKDDLIGLSQLTRYENQNEGQGFKF